MSPNSALPLARAATLRTLCAAPGMNAYKPIAAATVKVCIAAASLTTHKADKLAAFTVDQASILINRMDHVAVSPDILKALEIFEQKLDAIRGHIEQMVGKKFLAGYKVKKETTRLKADLERELHAVLAIGGTMSPGASRSDCVLELVSLSIGAAGAICEAPVLNFLKPVVGIAALICDTAKSVKGNRDAAAQLAQHAGAVTKCIVDRASGMDAAAVNNRDALAALKLALEDIKSHLILLATPRRRLAPWIFASQEKERFIQLNRALDSALAMFSAAQSLGTAADVRVVLSTVERLERSGSDIDRKLMIIHADLANLKLSQPASVPSCQHQPSPAGAQAEYRITAFVPILAPSQLTLFFFSSTKKNPPSSVSRMTVMVIDRDSL